MTVNNVKGTHDIIGKEALSFQAVENLLKQIAELFGFKEARPPVMEYSEVFVRGVGEGSDIVRKEMYTFLDKGNRSITLRPEFTAGIIRLMVQNKLLATSELPLKYYYCGPVFRYERPQLGRYRQFNQFGVESVGNPNPLADIEIISLAYTILQSLGLENVTLQINTLGDEASRTNYKVALKEYFAKHLENMCPDCKSRYELNPLRILDCKDPADKEIVKGAPKMSDFLSQEAKDKFQFVLDSLKTMGIPVEIDDTLVRGLDYYSDTVFEFHYVSKTGNDYGAVGAGGHYDRLIKEFGGPDLPGCGFSFGVERLVSVLTDDGLFPENIEDTISIYVMPMGKACQVPAMNIANSLRIIGYPTDICFDDVKLGNMFKRAERKGAKLAIILGENEINNDTVVLKNLKTQVQETVELEHLEDKVAEFLSDGEECGCGCGCGHHHHHEEGECCCGHHHDHECGCGCHEGKCHDCGHECGEMPCLTSGVCPCGENYQECECVIAKQCKCKKEGK